MRKGRKTENGKNRVINSWRQNRGMIWFGYWQSQSWKMEMKVWRRNHLSMTWKNVQSTTLVFLIVIRSTT